MIDGQSTHVVSLEGVPIGPTWRGSYFRGRTDAAVSRLLDLIWSFPALLLGVPLSTAITLRGAEIGPITIGSGQS